MKDILDETKNKTFLGEIKWFLIGGIIVILFITALLLFVWRCEDQRLLANNIIQASTIVILVAVTLSYAYYTMKLANQSKEQSVSALQQVEKTTELIEDQKLSRDLEFNERSLHGFYNPFILSLDLSKRKFGRRNIREIKKELDEPHQKIFNYYSYMLSQETIKIIREFFVDLGTKEIAERNNELEDEDKNKLFRLLNATRKMLHEERTEIEDYLSENYSFPEKKEIEGKS